ncbi:hypothetical protein ACSSVY_001337 [Roseovarius sp. MBR-51]
MTFIQTNRRRLLLGLAAASTAAATGAAAQGHAAPQEAPELLSLADGLSDRLQAYKDATAQVQQIAETWGPQWPKPDTEIFAYGEDCKTHRDILGRGIQTEGFECKLFVRDVGTPEHFGKLAKYGWGRYHHKMQTKTQRGAKLAQRWAEREAAKVEPARAYWSEVDRITEASGIEAAQERAVSARKELKGLVGQIIHFREKTVTGLIIKAQAMQAWQEVEPFYRQLDLDAIAWAEAMTATVLRQAA